MLPEIPNFHFPLIESVNERKVRNNSDKFKLPSPHNRSQNRNENNEEGTIAINYFVRSRKFDYH